LQKSLRAATVINKALEAGLIRAAGPERTLVGNVPHWA
jgi:hypothetical protein